jgi:hypothetical protein
MGHPGRDRHPGPITVGWTLMVGFGIRNGPFGDIRRTRGSDRSQRTTRRAHEDTCRELSDCTDSDTNVSSSENVRVGAPGRTMNSQAPGAMRPAVVNSKQIDRIRRRTRLRSTAAPTARGTANATRGWDTGRAESPEIEGISRFSARCTTVSGPLDTLRPRRASSTNVARSRMRQIRPIAGHDPVDGGSARCADRRGSPCGAGNHDGEHADGCSVDRSSSRVASSGRDG